MPTHLVQVTDGAQVRVAMVDEPHLRCLENVSSTYEIAQHCLRNSSSMEQHVRSKASAEALSYDDVYFGRSLWRLLAPIHVPDQPSRLLISGTGLTHIGS